MHFLHSFSLVFRGFRGCWDGSSHRKDCTRGDLASLRVRLLWWTNYRQWACACVQREWRWLVGGLHFCAAIAVRLQVLWRDTPHTEFAYRGTWILNTHTFPPETTPTQASLHQRAVRAYRMSSYWYKLRGNICRSEVKEPDVTFCIRPKFPSTQLQKCATPLLLR